MSGGRFNHNDNVLCMQIFNGLSSDMDIGSPNQEADAKYARTLNPLEDSIISELTYDVFCLIRSYDWYASDDTGIEEYANDVEAFKNKWLKLSAKKLAERTINNGLKDLEERLRRELGLNEPNV